MTQYTAETIYSEPDVRICLLGSTLLVAEYRRVWCTGNSSSSPCTHVTFGKLSKSCFAYLKNGEDFGNGEKRGGLMVERIIGSICKVLSI